MPHENTAERRDQVRLSEYAARVVRRWYIVVLCIVVAVLLVVLNTIGGGDKVQGQATIFLGQPFTPTGTQTIPATVSTNPTSASQYVRSDEPMERAAAASGIKIGALRSHTSVTSSSTSTAKTVTSSANVTITVRGPWKRDQVKTAVTSLADSLLDWANIYQSQKVELLERQIEVDRTSLATLQGVLDRAQRALERLARSAGSASTEAVLLQTVASAGGRIDDISYQLTSNEMTLTAAETVESAGYVSKPASQQVTATSRRSSLIVAAFAGLLLGVVLALAWDAVRGSRESP